MQGYKEFPADVRRVFGRIMTDYSLKVVNETMSMVLMKSGKCSIIISTENGYAEMAFRENEHDKWMMLGPYMQVLFPNDQIRFADTSGKVNREAVISSLHELSDIVLKYGERFLTGDFSWRDSYEDLVAQR